MANLRASNVLGKKNNPPAASKSRRPAVHVDLYTGTGLHVVESRLAGALLIGNTENSAKKHAKECRRCYRRHAIGISMGFSCNGSTCCGADDLFIGRCNRRGNSANERTFDNKVDKNGGQGGGEATVDRTVSSAAVKIRTVSSQR